MRAGLFSTIESVEEIEISLYLVGVSAYARASKELGARMCGEALGVEYFERSLELSRAGAVIVVDNVVRKGEVINDESEDASVLGVRRLIHVLSRETRVSCTAMQTVGSKGYDGCILAVVKGT